MTYPKLITSEEAKVTISRSQSKYTGLAKEISLQ
jgi:hypothetical protein